MAESVEMMPEVRAAFVHACELRGDINDASCRELWDLALQWRKTPSDAKAAKAAARKAVVDRCRAFGVKDVTRLNVKYVGDNVTFNPLAEKLLGYVGNPMSVPCVPRVPRHPLVGGPNRLRG